MELLVGILFVGIPLAILLFAVVWLAMGGGFSRPREWVSSEPDPNERDLALLEQDYNSGRISLEEYERRVNELERDH